MNPILVNSSILGNHSNLVSMNASMMQRQSIEADTISTIPAAANAANAFEETQNMKELFSNAMTREATNITRAGYQFETWDESVALTIEKELAGNFGI